MAKKPTKKKSVTAAKIAPTNHEESYFVSIRNPVELRRQLLESAKKSIYCLQVYYRIKLVRERKLKEMQRLRQLVQELQYLNVALTEKLPKHVDVSAHIKKSEKPSPKIHHTKSKPVQEKSDLDKLEEHLKKIEERLQRI